jgi:hypothetical protein
LNSGTSFIASCASRIVSIAFCAGFDRSFRYWNGQVVEEVDWNVPSVGRVISFGEDANREIYAITASNKIYRIAKM